MLKNVDQWIVNVVSVLLAAGLYVLSTYFTTVATALVALAGIVVGWLALPRLGDSRTAGVNVDDLRDSRS